MMHELLMTAVSTLAVIDPGQGEAPPGSDAFTTVVKWVAWVVFGLAVIGVLITAGGLAVQNRRGQAGEHAASLGWVCAACVVAASAGAIVGTFVG